MRLLLLPMLRLCLGYSLFLRCCSLHDLGSNHSDALRSQSSLGPDGLSCVRDIDRGEIGTPSDSEEIHEWWSRVHWHHTEEEMRQSRARGRRTNGVDSRQIDDLRWGKDGPLLPHSRPKSLAYPFPDALHLRVGSPGTRLHCSLAEIEEGRRQGGKERHVGQRASCDSCG